MGLFNLLKKPNGRKLDPLRGLMNLGSFTVSGINPATKRKKTEVVAAASADDAVKLSGLADAVAVESGWGVPTSTQLGYIKKCGLSLPDGATARDATALISRISHGEMSAVPSRLVIEAAAKGISMSFLTGHSQYSRYLEDWERGARGDNGRA